MTMRQPLAVVALCVMVVALPLHALGKTNDREDQGQGLAGLTTAHTVPPPKAVVDPDVLTESMAAALRVARPGAGGDTADKASSLRGDTARAQGCASHQDCVSCVEAGPECMFVAAPGDGPQCVPYKAPPQADDLSNAWAFNKRRAPVNSHSVLRYPDDTYEGGPEMLKTAAGICQIFTDQTAEFDSKHRTIRPGTIDCSHPEVWRLNLDNSDDAWARCAPRTRVAAEGGFSLDVVTISRQTLFWHGSSEREFGSTAPVFKMADSPGWLGARSVAVRYAGYVRELSNTFVAGQKSNPLRLVELSNLETLRWMVKCMIADLKKLPAGDLQGNEEASDILTDIQSVVASFTGNFFGNMAPFKAYRAVFQSEWSNAERTIPLLEDWPDEFFRRKKYRNNLPYISRMSEYSVDAAMAKLLCKYLRDSEEQLGRIHGYANPVVTAWRQQGEGYSAMTGLHAEIMVCDAAVMVEQVPVEGGVVTIDSVKVALPSSAR